MSAAPRDLVSKERAPTIAGLRALYLSRSLHPSDVFEDLLGRITAAGDDHVWICRVPEAAIRDRARALDAIQSSGGADKLPLFGIPFGIKDNIDAAGLPTTAACPDYAYVPTQSATAVQRLEAAGAILIGKTNLDQFATGLVGVRSPYGTPRNPFDPAYIPGGSSSGSAVAVTTGQVAFALGTDTAGSGRVPAAFNSIVGMKPTLGLVSTSGVVPACRSLDCVSVFALTVADGLQVLAQIAGPDGADPFSRKAPEGFALDANSAPALFDFAVPSPPHLRFFGNTEYERLFGEALLRMEALGGRRREVDFESFASAAAILYSDAGVAERLAAVGDFLHERPNSLLPVTRTIIERGRNATAPDVYRARERLVALKSRALALLEGTDILLVPSAPTIYRVDEVMHDPVALNANLGIYTNFVNLMDLAAVAVPSGFTRDGLPFGVTMIGRAFHDSQIAAIAAAFHDASSLKLGAFSNSSPRPQSPL